MEPLFSSNYRLYDANEVTKQSLYRTLACMCLVLARSSLEHDHLLTAVFLTWVTGSNRSQRSLLSPPLASPNKTERACPLFSTLKNYSRNPFISIYMITQFFNYVYFLFNCFIHRYWYFRCLFIYTFLILYTGLCELEGSHLVLSSLDLLRTGIKGITFYID